MSTKPRILALDLGRKRIGLAISDGLGITAQGLPTLERTNIRADIGGIYHLATDREARAILLGLPRTLRGDEARQANWVREFGARLEKRSQMPVVYWDERLTSVEAERVLRQEGGDRLSMKGKVDRLAAVILLQSYLDAGCPGLSATGGDALDNQTEQAALPSESDFGEWGFEDHLQPGDRE
ncbi:MAG: Holliday junction resolvase RuvX [Bryobacterales bacterium]|nr:Holliday junction resolvase RuvX [Bryobacterales bacterium]